MDSSATSLDLLVAPSPAQAPEGFERVAYTHRWEIPLSRDRVWAWLCDPRTFIEGQIWPYKVEFLANDDGPGDFRTGVYNAHFGPGMCFAGVLGEIRPGEYRDLQYSYGSFAVSHRLFRPTRLQFWAEDGDSGTLLRVQVDADVRTGWSKVWNRMMRLFWPRFGKWATAQA